MVGGPKIVGNDERSTRATVPAERSQVRAGAGPVAGRAWVAGFGQGATNTAEDVFQRLAQFVEEAEERGQPINWRQSVTERMIVWRAGEG
ncbi:hypothetical protein GCM10009858_04020 [Terrabacter carboxydivorans]|uniref:Uncharacterized protein n=1 Tax=Terrabacter carboxydivorans TaxID=619730 RepID=A0ABP5XVY8_9MICO